MYSFLRITEEVHLGNTLRDESIQQVLGDVVAQLRRISWGGRLDRWNKEDTTREISAIM